jgi:hypothetical protein
MLRGHVYIVNEVTLPVHLSHMFVGTNAGDKDNNISLLADMFRVKQGDFIFFYIEASVTKKGRFFGVFKATDNTVYHLEDGEAQQPNLPLKLIYRKNIEPYDRVYPEGVLEWIALDKLPTYSKELLWSLIYRKMKGGRGNTMLLPWEVKRLMSLIEDTNNGRTVTAPHYTFDLSSCTIQSSNSIYNHNMGERVNLPLENIKKSETAFQAYILQKLSIGNNTFYPEIFGKNIAWIGNEVFAGTGMQKIDILIFEKLDEATYIYRIIELKHPKSTGNITFASEQLRYYIDWAREDYGGHLLGGKKFNVKPILLSLTPAVNSIPSNIVNDIKELSSIAKDPEVWEADFSFQVKRL